MLFLNNQDFRYTLKMSLFRHTQLEKNVCRGIWRDSSSGIGERIILFSTIPSALNILNVRGTRSLGGLQSVVTDKRKKPIIFFSSSVSRNSKLPTEAKTTPVGVSWDSLDIVNQIKQ